MSTSHDIQRTTPAARADAGDGSDRRNVAQRDRVGARLTSPWKSPKLVVHPPENLEETNTGLAMRIVVAAGEVLQRTCLASLLQDHEQSVVVGVAGDAASLLELVRDRTPDLVILEVGLAPTQTVEWLQAAEQIRIEQPEIGIMVLSTGGNVEHARALLSTSQGIGYLLRDRVVDVETFFDGLCRVAQGGCILDPALVQELAMARSRIDPLARLSRREFDVLELMAEGRSNLAIAHEFSIAEGTIEKHVRSILTKLDLGCDPATHRRVLAVIAFRRAMPSAQSHGRTLSGTGRAHELRTGGPNDRAQGGHYSSDSRYSRAS
jgi:DNA-binding NarL/FixJ family response regulator